MIGEKEQTLLKAALIRSQRDAVTYAEKLDEIGLLLTDDRRAQLRRATLCELRIMLDHESPEGIARWHNRSSKPMTPAEMFYAMVAWLEDTFDLMMKEGEYAKDPNQEDSPPK